MSFFKNTVLLLVAALCASVPAQAATVDGTVRDPSGSGIPGIEVSLYRFTQAGGGGGWSVYAWTSTSADGSWSLADVPAGLYRLKYFDWSQRYGYEFYDDVTSFDLATDIEIDVVPVSIDTVLDPGGRISGTVSTPDGAPLENPAAVVFDGTGGVLYYTGISGTSYEVGGLADGEYLIRFTGAQFGSDEQWNYFSEWYDDAPLEDLATPVAVSAGQTTTGIDAVMGYDVAGSIAGVVVDLYRRPYQSARVEAWQTIDGEWQMIRADDTGGHGTDGEYTLDLPAGTYRLRFEGSTDYNLINSLVEWWPDASSIDEAADVVLADGDALSIDGVLGELATGAISGTVTNGDGSPADQIEVSIWGFAGELYRHFTRTGPDGSYVIDGLQPDRYLLQFFDPEHQLRWSYLGGGQNPNQADRVQVFYDPVTAVDQALLPGVVAGSLTGFVTDPLGIPAAGISVRASDPSDPYDTVGWGTTHGDGSFRLLDLPDGSVIVSFQDLEGRFVDEWFDDVGGPDDATPVPISQGAATTGVDAVLDTAGGISGSVVDAYGRPFTITTINAFEWDGAQWRSVAGTYLYRESDYLLAGLPPGSYRIAFSGGGFSGPRVTEWFDDAPDVDSADDVEVAVGQITTGIDAVIGTGPGGAIAGTVTDGAGLPVEGIEVRLYDENLLPRGVGASTATDGSYLVDLLSSGLYYVEFVDPSGVLPGEFFDNAASLGLATPIRISGAPVTGADAVLDGPGSGPGGGAIAGLITDQLGSALGGIRIDCFRTDFSDQPPCSGVSQSDGSFVVGGNLPEADYWVRFTSTDGDYVAEYYDDAPSLGDATPVGVILGSVTGDVDADLAAAGGIAGRVTDGSGQPLSTLLVTAYRWVDGEWRQVASTVNTYQSDYEITGLEPASYRIRFADGYEGFFGEAEFYDDAATIETASDVIVSAGELTTGIDAVLREDQPGGVSGSVVDGGGAPASGIEVTAYDAAGEVSAVTTTAADGSFLIPDLIPGRYAVGFADPTGALPSEFFSDVPDLDSSTPVDVGYNVVVAVDAVLDGANGTQGGAAIEGLVTDADSGLPIADAEVLCFEPSGFLIPRCRDLTDADGSYRLGGFLPARPVLVRFRAPDGGFFSEWFDDAGSFVDATAVSMQLGETTAGIDAALIGGDPLRNPDFDIGLDEWVLIAPEGTDIEHASIDAHGDGQSGSARLWSNEATSRVIALEQCRRVSPGPFVAGARVRIEGSGIPLAVVAAELFADDECVDPTGTVVTGALVEGTTSALWRDVSAPIDVPDGVGSLELRFELHTAGGDGVDSHWDALSLRPSTSLFGDGFETGTLAAWDGTVGP